MRRLILILSFLHAATASFSQAPGYMGKKLSFYYTPALFPSLQHETSYGGVKVGINVRNDLSLDYVISKSVALGGSFKYITTELANAFYYNEVQNPFPSAFLGDVKLRGPAFSIYVKNFNYGKRR